MRAHLVQLDIAWEDPDANFTRVADLLDQADVAPGDFILLPEMFDTGFSLNVEKTADTDGRAHRFLAQLAQQRAVTVQGGLTIAGPDARGLNRAVAFDPQGVQLTSYDKLHPFTFGREGERFTGGDRVALYTWKIPEPGQDAHLETTLRICPIVCYDLRFPELFRAGLALGAEMYAIGANWPAARAQHWRALIIARAIENQAVVLGVNRCGSDPHLDYAGGSIAVDAQGQILAEAGVDECVLSVPIDAAALRKWRETFPAWRDLRSELQPPMNPDGGLQSLKTPSENREQGG